MTRKARKKRLIRSSKNRVMTGLFGGLGDYFGVDPTILRLLGILVAIFTGFFPGLIVYLIGSLVVPVK